jgi:predicted acylesterase/phospholipase RssA
MDGAIVSNLPIEPALRAGATEIIALDLLDARMPFGEAHGLEIFLNKLAHAVERRQVDVELDLARTRCVPVFYMGLTSRTPVPMWDFRFTDELVGEGYAIARRLMEEHRSLRLPSTADVDR